MSLSGFFLDDRLDNELKDFSSLRHGPGSTGVSEQQLRERHRKEKGEEIFQTRDEMGLRSGRAFDINIQERVAVYVLACFLSATNCTVVQIPKTGGCCIPTSSKWHDRTSAMVVTAAAVHEGVAVPSTEQKESRRQPLSGSFCSGGTKPTKPKLCPFTRFSQQSHS